MNLVSTLYSTHVLLYVAFPPPVGWKDHLCRPTPPLSAAAAAFPAAASSQRWTGKIQQENRESDNEAGHQSAASYLSRLISF